MTEAKPTAVAVPAPSVAAPDATSASGAARLAERALLGVLLHRPDLTAHLEGWLRADDLADPTHRAIYGAFLRRDSWAAGSSAGPTDGLFSTVAAVRADVLDRSPSQTGTGLIGVLTSLSDINPATITAAHLTRYARITLHDSTRRRLTTWGARFERAADAADPVHAIAAVSTDMLADLATRSGHVGASAGGSLPTEPAASSSTRGSRHSHAETPALGDPEHPLSPVLIERAERQLIHAVLSDPAWQHAAVLDRLEPSDFTANADHAPTWHAIRELHTAGEPIDPVLVAWKLETTANPDDGAVPGMSPDDLATARRPPTDPSRALTTVVRAAAAHRARAAAASIAQASRHPDSSAMLAEATSAARTAHAAAHRMARTLPVASPIARALDQAGPSVPRRR